MKCIECGEKSAKYKFKCCLRRFCSNECYKSHNCKDSQGFEPSLEPKPEVLGEEKQIEVEESEQQPFVVEKEQLEQIENQKVWKRKLTEDVELKRKLGNKRLQKILREIADARDPLHKAQSHLRDGAFNEFLDHIIPIIS